LLHNLLNLLAEITSRYLNSGLVICAALCDANLSLQYPARYGKNHRGATSTKRGSSAVGLGRADAAACPQGSRRYDDAFWKELLGGGGKKSEAQNLKELGF